MVLLKGRKLRLRLSNSAVILLLWCEAGHPTQVFRKPKSKLFRRGDVPLCQLLSSLFSKLNSHAARIHVCNLPQKVLMIFLSISSRHSLTATRLCWVVCSAKACAKPCGLLEKQGLCWWDKVVGKPFLFWAKFHLIAIVDLVRKDLRFTAQYCLSRSILLNSVV